MNVHANCQQDGFQQLEKQNQHCNIAQTSTEPALPGQGLTTIAQVVAGQHMHVGGMLAKDVTCRGTACVSTGLSQRCMHPAILKSLLRVANQWPMFMQIDSTRRPCCGLFRMPACGLCDGLRQT